jgi:hypothetical protein
VAEPVRQNIWAYHVTAWPEWLENDEDARDDALTLSISVERQGRGDQWALFLGRFGGRDRPVWTSPGGWVLVGEPPLLAEQEALALARQLAPQVSIMGWSAYDAIANWAREKRRE